MEPIIYVLPILDKIIKSSEIDINFGNYPSPKLIKYGFNSVNEQLNMLEITSVPYYRAGLNFDFDRNDETSISNKAGNLLGTKNFDINFAELWEIITIFGILDQNQTIFTSIPDILKEITNIYQKFSKTQHKYKIEESSTNKLMDTSVSLVVHKYSNINIDENVAIQFIISNINELLRIQVNGANMILQLFNLQTQTSAEIIYFLSTLYNSSYLIKPTVTSDLSDSKYLVLVGFKNASQLDIPKHPENLFLVSLGLQNIPEDIVIAIQCMNSEIIPKKYKKYSQIKEYLDSKVYEGATYNEMIKSQDENTDLWIKTFVNFDNISKLMDQAIKKSTNKCANRAQLISLLN